MSKKDLSGTDSEPELLFLRYSLTDIQEVTKSNLLYPLA
jgi:hypothetical protein